MVSESRVANVIRIPKALVSERHKERDDRALRAATYKKERGLGEGRGMCKKHEPVLSWNKMTGEVAHYVGAF